MFRRMIIAMLVGVLAALAVALFRHAMTGLESLFLGNDSGSLVNAAESLPPWRRLLTPALGGLAAGALLWLWQRRALRGPVRQPTIWKRSRPATACLIRQPAW
jgi:CIC family chloride channel protein